MCMCINMYMFVYIYIHTYVHPHFVAYEFETCNIQSISDTRCTYWSQVHLVTNFILSSWYMNMIASLTLPIQLIQHPHFCILILTQLYVIFKPNFGLHKIHNTKQAIVCILLHYHQKCLQRLLLMIPWSLLTLSLSNPAVKNDSDVRNRNE